MICERLGESFSQSSHYHSILIGIAHQPSSVRARDEPLPTDSFPHTRKLVQYKRIDLCELFFGSKARYRWSSSKVLGPGSLDGDELRGCVKAGAEANHPQALR